LEGLVLFGRKIVSRRAALLIAFDLLAGGGILADGHFVAPAFAAPPHALAGTASWYGEHWKGRKTASGTRFDPNRLTAAHRSLPLNTRVRVTNLENAKSVTVLVNDRGPYVRGRVIDLSTAAARRLGMVKEGLAPVRIEVVAPPPASRQPVVADAANELKEPGRHSPFALPAVSGFGAAAILIASLLAACRLRAKSVVTARAES
jgi:peptidoglycan lytic transglycosylase